MTSTWSLRARTLALSALLIGTLLIYRPVLLATTPWIYEDSLWRPVHALPPWNASHLIKLGMYLVIRAWEIVAGESAQAGHALNVIVHLANAAILGGIVARETQIETGGWIAAAVWLWHPLQVPAVAYASSIGELLVTTGVLIVLAALLSRPLSRTPILIAALAILGTLLVKSTGVSVLAVPLILAATVRRDTLGAIPRRGWLAGLGVGLLAMGALSWIIIVHSPLVVIGFQRLPYATAQLVALARTGVRVIVPTGVALEHDWSGTSLPLTAAWIFALAFVTALAWSARRTAPWIACGICWWVVVLAPRVFVPAAQEYLYDYQVMPALIGPVVACACGWPGWRRAGVPITERGFA